MSNCVITFFDGEAVGATLVRFDRELRPVIRFHSGFEASIDHDSVAGISFAKSLWGIPNTWGGFFGGIEVFEEFTGEGELLFEECFDALKIIRLSDCNYIKSERTEYKPDIVEITRRVADVIFEYTFESGFLTDITVWVNECAHHVRVAEAGTMIPVWCQRGEEENGIPHIVRDDVPADHWTLIEDEVLLFVGVKKLPKDETLFGKLMQEYGSRVHPNNEGHIMPDDEGNTAEDEDPFEELDVLDDTF